MLDCLVAPLLAMTAAVLLTRIMLLEMERFALGRFQRQEDFA